jgi:hypothetical protein
MTNIPLFAWIKRMMIQTLNIFNCCHCKEILMKVSELAVAVSELSAQLAKAQGEILGKIADLEEALATMDVELPEDAAAALEGLRVSAQALDDIVPDVAPE